MCFKIKMHLFAVLCLIAGSRSLSLGTKLVIDQDGGADDAMAIFIALLYEKNFHGPTIVGITTSHGNVDEPQAFINTQKFLNVAERRDVPIYRGSNYSLVKNHPPDCFFGFDGLGDLENVSFVPIEARHEHAVNALIRLSKKYEGQLSVVVLGALTNIALAIRLDPKFISRLAQIYIAAGNDYSKVPHPQYNAEMDVEAYYVVVESCTPDKATFIFSQVFHPELTGWNITTKWRNEILGAIDTPIMRALIQYERIADNFNVLKISWISLDPLAMCAVLNDTLVWKTECVQSSIILCGEQRSININNYTDCADSNIKIIHPGPHQEYEIFLYNVFSET